MKPVVLITGASQGIGAAIAKQFAREIKGVKLALISRNGKKLAGVAKTCARLGASAEIFLSDVSNAASVELMAEEVTKRFRSVDVLINNAGIFEGASFEDTTVDQFDRVVAANLRSAFLVTHAFLPGMRKRKRGDVFFMSSMAGLTAYPNGAAYCAAKFGVTGMAKVLRAETKGSGIRVCCVHPGATWSPSWEGTGISKERFMPAEDIARAFYEVYHMSRKTVVEEIVLRPEQGDI